MNALKKFTRSKIFVLLLLLILVTVFFSVMTNGTFIGLVNIRNIFNSMVVTAFLTVGAVPLMISGHIDLSAGNVGSMSGMLMALLLTNCGLPWPIAVLLALAAAAVFGQLNGALVNRFGFPSGTATLNVASM